MQTVTRKNVNHHRKSEEESELRRGPWTLEEDTLLIHYIARNGEGNWNSAAKGAGLKRTGKSCRLRWLNYLKPDIKRGNLTPHEQLLILELHSKWGNRWSKIAQHLPGRTDNGIKNYWRTRVQKQARKINTDQSNDKGFVDALRCFGTPRLLPKLEQSSPSDCNSTTSLSTISNFPSHQNCAMSLGSSGLPEIVGPSDSSSSINNSPNEPVPNSSHPKGCLIPFRNQNFLSETEEHPKPNNISNFYAVDKAHHVTCNNIPVAYMESSSVNNYVDMKISENGIESLINLSQFSDAGSDFGISGLDYQVAAGDHWLLDGMTGGDSFWNMGKSEPV